MPEEGQAQTQESAATTEPQAQNTQVPEQKGELNGTEQITYTDFKVPDGMELDKGLLDEFTPLAKELKLPQDQAQKFVDLHAAWTKKQQESVERAFQAGVDEWMASSKGDKEYGGAKFDENLSVARTALQKFGTNELREALELTGMGNHPEMVRFMYRVGKAIGEDRMPSGGMGSEPKEKDPAKVLFPNQN